MNKTQEERLMLARAVGKMILEGEITRFGQLYTYMPKSDWGKVFDFSKKKMTSVNNLLSNMPQSTLLEIVRWLHIKPSVLMGLLDAQKAYNFEVHISKDPFKGGLYLLGKNVRPANCPVYPMKQVLPISASIFMLNNLRNHDKRHIGRPGAKENGAH